MKRRSRSILKWAGTVLTVLLLVLWVGSAWCGLGGFVRPTAIAGIDSGGLFMHYESSNMLAEIVSVGEWPLPLWRHRASMKWWYYWQQLRFSRTGLVARADLFVPLWPVILASGLPTAILWYRDRHRALGLCIKCGYDLRGNASGVCPECGLEQRVER